MDADHIALEREALESTYEGLMTVQNTIAIETDWGETREEDILIYQDKPCALSQSGNSKADKKEGYSEINYVAKLFCAPELVIPAGSTVTVAQHGMAYTFTHSGEAFIYPTHQEITIERLDKA